MSLAKWRLRVRGPLDTRASHGRVSRLRVPPTALTVIRKGFRSAIDEPQIKCELSQSLDQSTVAEPASERYK